VSVVTTHLLGGPWDYANSPELLNSYNFLNISTPVVFSHASFMTTQGAELLVSTNQYISTTPESELQYGHGHPQTYLSQDQAALGIDTHFTYSADIITQARLWLQSVRNILYSQVLANWNVGAHNPMSANQAFMLATRHGGLALRRPDLGIIAEGAKADLVVFSGNSPGLIGWVDPVAAVILHSNVGDIQHVLVDGKFVKRDGQLTLNNYTGIQQRFLNSARRIQEVWKGIPYPELVGQFGRFSAYQDPMQEDTLRGNGTGYGTLFV
jgi:cytosine/adenosine deaminase-related metal-dependent hydrolase